MSIGSLFSGVSALTANQKKMDVIGNNLANSNANGFKASRVNFADTLYNTISEATAPTDDVGGTGPAQIGQGTIVSSIVRDFSQGTLRQTGRSHDLAISGDGFLAITNGREIFYTRDGALGLDGEGALIHLASGLRVIAFSEEVTDGFNNVSPTDTLKILVGQKTLSKLTSQLLMGGNLAANAAPGDVVNVSMTVFDSLGSARDLTLEFTRSVNPGEWGVTASSPVGAITFPPNGDFVAPPTPASISGSQGSFPLTLQNGISDEILVIVNGGTQRTLDLVGGDTTFTSVSSLVDAVNNAIASDTGAATLTGTGAPTSLTINGTNDQFQVAIDGGGLTTISIDQATYADVAALAANIQAKLDAAFGVAEITADVNGGAIRLRRATGQDRSLQAAEGNAGLANLNIGAATVTGGLAGQLIARVVDSRLTFESTRTGASSNLTLNSGGNNALLLLGFNNGDAVTGADIVSAPGAILEFDEFGQPLLEELSFTFVYDNPEGAQNPQTITANFEAVTQQAVAGTVAVRSQDGLPPGLLTTFKYNPDGVIIGVFDNGLSAPVGQLVLAQFQNPTGLYAAGGNMWASSVNSGAPIMGRPGDGSLGLVLGAQLEGSNVDLGQEFADMIVTQRSFQAAARIITTSDEMLQELTNLIR